MVVLSHLKLDGFDVCGRASEAAINKLAAHSHLLTGVGVFIDIADGTINNNCSLL